MKITFSDFWDEYGGLIIAVCILLFIIVLSATIALALKPDYYIYEFHTFERIISFEVESLIDQDYSSYTFLLTDGRKVTYHPDYGTTVYITEVRN